MKRLFLKFPLYTGSFPIFSEVCSQDSAQEGILYMINFMEVNLTLQFQ